MTLKALYICRCFMRNLEILAAACVFSMCISATPITKHLYTQSDVQVFCYTSTEEKSDIALDQTNHGGAEYLNKIVFLGDSRTYGLKAFSMLSGGKETKQVWTPRNGTMSIWDMKLQKIVHPASNSEITCAEAAAIEKPEILIISLGLNGVEIVNKDYFVSEYTKLIDSIKAASPNTKIILQSMLPVCRSYTLINNDEIREGNNWIIEIAQSTGSYYLNTQEVFCDNEGFLKDEYSTDGCHLTPLGLDVQIEYICTHMIGDK